MKPMNPDLLQAEIDANERAIAWLLIDSQEEGGVYDHEAYQELIDQQLELQELLLDAQGEAQASAEALSANASIVVDLAHLTDDLLAELRTINKK